MWMTWKRGGGGRGAGDDDVAVSPRHGDVVRVWEGGCARGDGREGRGR